jgi:hypothetical protein
LQKHFIDVEQLKRDNKALQSRLEPITAELQAMICSFEQSKRIKLGSSAGKEAKLQLQAANPETEITGPDQ